LQIQNMRYFSSISTGLALLCAIHCALMPIFLSLMPLFAGKLAAYHWLEWLLIGSSAVLGGIPLFKTYPQHGNKIPMIGFVIGFSLIAIEHYIFAHDSVYFLTISGAVILVVVQLYNVHLLRHISCGHAEKCC